jgi:hypothetical protein
MGTRPPTAPSTPRTATRPPRRYRHLRRRLQRESDVPVDAEPGSSNRHRVPTPGFRAPMPGFGRRMGRNNCR